MKLKVLNNHFEKKALRAQRLAENAAWRSRRMEELHPVDKVYQTDENIISHHLSKMFPIDFKVKATLEQFVDQTREAQPNDIYTSDYLPFHTRDNAWLVEYATNVVNENEPDSCIKPSSMKKFVSSAPAFNAVRCGYEQSLVRVQIPYLLNATRPNALLGKHRCPADFDYRTDYDQFFRDEVVKSFSDFGLDQHLVETVVEENAAVWRRPTMLKAFENRYYSDRTMNYLDPNDFSAKRLMKLKTVHQNLWLQRREYEYYQDHRAIIDELGLATANMKMKPRAVRKLTEQLEKCERIRKRLLEKTVYCNQAFEHTL